MTDKSREPQNETTQESYMAIGAEIGLPLAEWFDSRLHSGVGEGTRCVIRRLRRGGTPDKLELP